ncbi:phosphoadenosine phosphosulfate reductase family protein [Embleya scabrispora]|uniref:phosphoadenosine phosphosulfate reductase domain-containing protein n=1 Tax=Embleya scabrispora TaxID=159449 RepID=UPI001374D8BD|nr:phosphoadenosine phosphosulfate reductase family protein [Embleya scabrispora]
MKPSVDPTPLYARLGSSARMRTKTLRAHERVRRIAAHGGYAAWSGGKDSTVVAHLVRETGMRVCFFDSGMELPETVPYIVAVAQQLDLRLESIAARPSAWESLEASRVWENGSPLAPDWRRLTNLHELTIAGPSRTAHRRYGAGEVLGLRAAEGVKRRRLFAHADDGVYRRLDGTAVACPIWDWTDDDVLAYLAYHRIGLNPIYDKLRAVGAPPRARRVDSIFDDTALTYGRLVWLQRGWPSVYDELIRRLPRIRDYA